MITEVKYKQCFTNGEKKKQTLIYYGVEFKFLFELN